jgi:hypothetical protein
MTRTILSTGQSRERAAFDYATEPLPSCTRGLLRGEHTVDSIAGIFVARDDAIQAARALGSLGFAARDIIFLLPGSNTQDLAWVPSEDAEQPGIGKAVGGVVGGALGLGAGAIIGSLLLPGIGPVLAVTFGAAAAGLGGAVAGAAAGGLFEEMLTRGVPKDELFFYEDALRKNHTVLIALSDNREKVDAARDVLRRYGAESIDAARENWWIGIRDAEALEYPDREHFQRDEKTFREGFTAALEPEARGRSFEELAAYLEKNHPVRYREISFRRGFERGRIYYEIEVKQFHGSAQGIEDQAR